MRIVFGSCRVAAPHEPPHTLRKDEHPDGPRGRRAARARAAHDAHQPPDEWPHALLLLGDQVYADEVHPDVEEQLDGEQVDDFDDYVELYIAVLGRAGDPLAALDRCRAR